MGATAQRTALALVEAVTALLAAYEAPIISHQHSNLLKDLFG